MRYTVDMENGSHNPAQQVLAAWHFPEYQVYDRSQNWFFTAIFVGGFLVLYSIWTSNFLFAGIIILAALILLIQIYRGPENVVFAILPHGMVLGDSFFRFHEVNKFWIAYNPPQVKKLYVELKSNWRPRLVIPLQEQDPVRLRKLLKKFISEDLEREGESLTDQISRFFKI